MTALGYEEPTPVQRETIPVMLRCSDLLAQTATGTGKTAAFALPLIQRPIEPAPQVDMSHIERAERSRPGCPGFTKSDREVPEDLADAIIEAVGAGTLGGKKVKVRRDRDA